MKQIDKFVFKSFLPPYILSFFVAEFVLLMQFLWKYIDEILGKGFSLGVILELLFYFAITIMPMAIPITILISSVMVFGNMAEKFELSSFKSSGISLMRIMAAGILIAILTGMFSLFASNYLKPKANYKFLERFNSVRRQKPALSIEENVFNKDFTGYAIRVGSKDRDEVGIHDILIYDHTENDKSKVNFVKADSGRMYSDEGAFVMQLHDGEQYREIKPKKVKNNRGEDSHPFIRTRFKTWNKIFDLSQFDMDAQNLNLSRKKYDLLNAFQLADAIDTLQLKRKEQKLNRIGDYQEMISQSAFDALGIISPSDKRKKIKSKDPIVNSKSPNKVQVPAKPDSINIDSVEHLIQLYPVRFQKELIKSVKSVVNARTDRLSSAKIKDEGLYRDWSYHQLRLHQQFSWALICIIFLFIGGPFGSIVRKGGYGYPLLVSIIFFVLFIIFNIAGEKLNKSMSIHPIFAAWLPCIILTPFAIWFTIKAINDRSLNLAAFEFITKLFSRKEKELS